MMETYQPIYDAVRSRLSNGDIGRAVTEAVHAANISHYVESAATLMVYEVANVMKAYATPSAIYRPTIRLDGTEWCALYGENLQDGVAGFGTTPEAAMLDFDRAWVCEVRAPRGHST
jgi:hypothetical protein